MYNNEGSYYHMETITFQVPPISKRKRIPADAIKSVVEQIVMKFNPKKVILFGSYAYGQPKPESDVDLLVIMDTRLSGIRQAIEINNQIQYTFGLDLLVYTPERLQQRISWGDQFLREIVSRGKIVYESTNSGMD